MAFIRDLFDKNRQIILYGFLLAFLVFTLKYLQWKFLIVDNSLDIYVGLISILFTLFGVWMSSHILKPKIQTLIVEKEVYIQSPDKSIINEAALKNLSLSNREYEVLQLLTKGYSNGEIAEKLFLSLSTIKTHVSNLFMKMEVKSRTQAIEKAKRLKITL